MSNPTTEKLTPDAFFADQKNSLLLEEIADQLQPPLGEELRRAITRLANLHQGVLPTTDQQAFAEIPAEPISPDEMRELLGRVHGALSDAQDKKFVSEVAQLLSIPLPERGTRDVGSGGRHDRPSLN
jgi:hypothetical protein